MGRSSLQLIDAVMRKPRVHTVHARAKFIGAVLNRIDLQPLERNVKALFVAGMSVLVLLIAVPTAGQTSPDQPDPRSSTRFHVGPLHFTPLVTLRELGVDTNVFNTAADRQKDFTLTAGPTVTAFLFVRRATISSTTAIDYTYYQKFKSQRSTHTNTVVSVQYPFGKFNLSSGVAFLDTRNRPNIEIDARAHRREHRVDAGVSYRWSPKLEFSLSGHRSAFSYDDETFLGEDLRSLNHDTRGASVSGRYSLTTLTAVILTVTAETDEFEISPDRNTESVIVTSGVEFKPLALISGTASVGFRSFQTLTDNIPDYVGVVLDGSLSYTWQVATNFNVTARRAVNYSYDTAYPYYLGEEYGLTIRRRVGGAYDLKISGQHQYLRYRRLGEGFASSREPRRVDLTHSYSMGAGYTLTDGPRIGVDAIYSLRQSNTFGQRDYSGWRIGTSVTYGF